MNDNANVKLAGVSERRTCSRDQILVLTERNATAHTKSPGPVLLALVRIHVQSFGLLVPPNSVRTLPIAATHCERTPPSSSRTRARSVRIPRCVTDQTPCSVTAHGAEICRRISPRKSHVCRRHEVIASQLAVSDSDRAAPCRALRSIDWQAKVGVNEEPDASICSGIPVSAHQIVPIDPQRRLNVRRSSKRLNQDASYSRAAQNQPRNH